MQKSALPTLLMGRPRRRPGDSDTMDHRTSQSDGPGPGPPGPPRGNRISARSSLITSTGEHDA